jgi:hypothetical protein
MGETITLTTRPDVEASDKVLPVTYPKLHNMCEPGGAHQAAAHPHEHSRIAWCTPTAQPAHR